MNRILGVIPARMGSTRLIGKPLRKILQKPLLQWVIEGARKSKALSELIVATDHEDIVKLSESLGVEAVMTDPLLPSGSDRAWAVAKNRPCDFVINIQGDEPLLRGEVLDTLARALNPEIELATLARPIKNLEELQNPGFAKIALNHKGEALYFSRAPIPYPRNGKPSAHLKHIGLYGFRKDFLERFCNQGPVELELTESLEQLRALWMGAKIKVILTDYDSWGVDTEEDVERVERKLGSMEGRER